MPYEIFPTTAEHVIGITDAVLLANTGCDENFVARFLDIPLDSAKNALNMGEQIGLITFDSSASVYLPSFPFAKYLVTSNEQQKATIIRLLLEQYEPYKSFKRRLVVTEFADMASQQVKVQFNLNAHRDEIKNTITSLGTYAQSLISEGAGLYKIAEQTFNKADYLLRLNEIVSQREKAEIIVRKLIGEQAQEWVDNTQTLEPLITAYQKLSDAEADSRSPVLYAGNAFESFLVKLANHHGVSLNNASGINSKLDAIASAHHLMTKHKFMGKYLGHIRNACDHGTDQEIGQAWQISPKTSHEYVHVTMSCIESIIDALNGIYKI